MPECENCGGHVTPDFARVFGSNDNDVQACIECATFEKIQNGHAGRDIAVADGGGH